MGNVREKRARRAARQPGGMSQYPPVHPMRALSGRVLAKGTWEIHPRPDPPLERFAVHSRLRPSTAARRRRYDDSASQGRAGNPWYYGWSVRNPSRAQVAM